MKSKLNLTEELHACANPRELANLLDVLGKLGASPGTLTNLAAEWHNYHYQQRMRGRAIFDEAINAPVESEQ